MKEINDVAKETLDVLKHFNNEFVSKIPRNVIKQLEELATDSDEKAIIDKSKKLNEQAISEECKSLISMIYYNYFANEEEKKEILNIWNENERLYQEELNKKYKIDNLFKNHKQRDDLQKKLLAIKENKNLFQKIWSFIGKILRVHK